MRNVIQARAGFIRICVLALALVMTGCAEVPADHAMHESANGEPVNYLVYDPSFSSAGMPDAAFIERLATHGVDIVINVAPHTASGALANEAQLVSNASMTYLNIPVDWNQPTQNDVDEFLAFMQANENANVFLHCQMNMRATAFAMLHRVINEGVEPSVAVTDMHTIWTPNVTWAALMNDAFARRNINYTVAASTN